MPDNLGTETSPARPLPGWWTSSAPVGEIEALTASGDPPGEHPDIELVVQLRAAQAGGPRFAPGPGMRNRPPERDGSEAR